VNAPHFIQNTPHTIPNFLLTLKIEGVETQSFFGTFKVFPVGAASGAQAKSPFASQDAAREGEQGSIAKRWSRRIKRIVEGKIRIPRRQAGLSGWR
jgi:hypothetical protein